MMNQKDFPFGTKVRVTKVAYGNALSVGDEGVVNKTKALLGDHILVRLADKKDAFGAPLKWYFRYDGSDGLIEPVVEAPAVPAITDKSPTIDKVLAFLASGKTLTQGEAILIGFGTRLASHIDRLRKRGHKITMTLKTDTNGRQYGEYALRTTDRFGNTKKAA